MIKRLEVKQIFSFLFVLFFVLNCLVVSSLAADVPVLKKKVVKIEKEIKRLNQSLKRARTKAKRAQLQDLIDGHEARVRKINMEIAIATQPKEELALPTPEAVSQMTDEEKMLADLDNKPLPQVDAILPEKTALTIIKEKKPARFKFDLGFSFGLYCGANSFLPELRFGLPYVFGPATTTMRIVGGYAQGKDLSKRYVPLAFDFMLNYPPGWLSGVENYVGGGLNYVLLTNGRVPGTIGAELFYGVESKGLGGKLFGELGYGALRTGFSPSQKGVTVMVGYRQARGLF